MTCYVSSAMINSTRSINHQSPGHVFADRLSLLTKAVVFSSANWYGEQVRNDESTDVGWHQVHAELARWLPWCPRRQLYLLTYDWVQNHYTCWGKLGLVIWNQSINIISVLYHALYSGGNYAYQSVSFWSHRVEQSVICSAWTEQPITKHEQADIFGYNKCESVGVVLLRFHSLNLKHATYATSAPPLSVFNSRMKTRLFSRCIPWLQWRHGVGPSGVIPSKSGMTPEWKIIVAEFRKNTEQTTSEGRRRQR